MTKTPKLRPILGLAVALGTALAFPSSLAASERGVQSADTPTFADFENQCRVSGQMSDDCTVLMEHGAEYVDLSTAEAASCDMASFWATFDAVDGDGSIAAGNWDIGIGQLMAGGACSS